MFQNRRMTALSELRFDNTFVDPPASFATDLAELRRILG